MSTDEAASTPGPKPGEVLLIRQATGSMQPVNRGLLIGRDHHCSVRVSDPTVSRLHARIVQDEAGLRIVDAGSSNGTFVNGRRVTEASIAPGDRIRCGASLFRVFAKPAAAPTADDRRLQARSALRFLARELSRAQSRGDIGRTARDALFVLVGADRVFMVCEDEDTGDLEVTFIAARPGLEPSPDAAPSPTTQLLECARTGRTIHSVPGPGESAVLTVPIPSGPGRASGAIALERLPTAEGGDLRRFERSEAWIANAIARLVAGALESFREQGAADVEYLEAIAASFVEG